MEILERPYCDYKFVVNIEDKDLNKILDSIDEIDSVDKEKVCISYGVNNHYNSTDKLSIWVSPEIDVIVFRNQIYQSMLRIQSEYYVRQGKIFDNENIWYPIFREADLLGEEWCNILKAVINRHILYSRDYEQEPEYIVAKDLYDRYKQKLEENPYYLFSLELNTQTGWEEQGETGWVLKKTEKSVLKEDKTRICMIDEDEYDEETTIMLDNIYLMG